MYCQDKMYHNPLKCVILLYKRGEKMNRIRNLRKEKKLTLKQLSEELAKQGYKITPDALSKYERGDREPKLDGWAKLADFFGVSIGYLQGVSDIKDRYEFSFETGEDQSLASKRIFDQFFKHFKKTADPLTGREGAEVPSNEIAAFNREHSIRDFINLESALLADQGRSTSEYHKKIQKIDDVAILEDIAETLRMTFKIIVDAKTGDLKAENTYKLIENILWNYNDLFDYDFPDYKIKGRKQS